MAEELALFFAGGREFNLDTAASENDFTIQKVITADNRDYYKITVNLIVSNVDSKSSIKEFKELNLKSGETIEDLQNVLYLNDVYKIENDIQKVNILKPNMAKLSISGYPTGSNETVKLKMNFDIGFQSGGKTKQGGFEKTKQGGI